MPGTREELRVLLRELAAQSLCVPPGEVPFDGELANMGLDSVLALEFVLQVNDLIGTELTVRELRQNPTIDLLADFLDTEGTRR
jgi:aryl carrier-like protein